MNENVQIVTSRKLDWIRLIQYDEKDDHGSTKCIGSKLIYSDFYRIFLGQTRNLFSFSLPLFMTLKYWYVYHIVICKYVVVGRRHGSTWILVFFVLFRFDVICLDFANFLRLLKSFFLCFGPWMFNLFVCLWKIHLKWQEKKTGKRPIVYFDNFKLMWLICMQIF